MPRKRLCPFFSYFGSKYRLAPRYPEPYYHRLVEPFAGSAQYSLLYPTREVHLFDLSEDVCRIWEYLIGVTPREIEKLPSLNQGDRISEIPRLTDTQRLYLRYNSNQGRYSSDKVHTWGAQSWNRRKSKIAAQLEYIRHWNIVQGPYELADLGSPSTYYVDPPYQHQGHQYQLGSKGIDFWKLGKWCKSLNGQVIVCEREGADWLPFKPFHTCNDVCRVPKQEVMWYMYD